MKKDNRLTDVEYTTCWMAIRYAMNRKTIASATLPEMLVKAFFNRLTEGQKAQIVKELAKNEEECLEWSNGKSGGFGHIDIDRPHWMKFWKALESETHWIALLSDNIQVRVFEANGKVYPLDKYVTSPHQEIYIPQENIVRKIIIE
jgi:hypothetical protein